MKISKFVFGLFLAATVSPASAQSVPSDVRCLLLSNAFAKQTGAEQGRQAAAQALIFYVGRLDGRADAAAITSAMRTQSASIDMKTAGTEMQACVARLAHAQQTIQELGRAAASTK
jgi:hypothetical protein